MNGPWENTEARSKADPAVGLVTWNHHGPLGDR